MSCHVLLNNVNVQCNVNRYEYGYSRVTLPNASALHIEFILNNNTVKDELWMYK